MGFFTPDTEKDAIRQIEKINAEFRAISASVHLNYNMIDGRNRSVIKRHLDNIMSYASKYERIKNNLSDFERMMLLGCTVDVWNGERVGVLMWETYFTQVSQQLINDLNY